MATKDNKHLDNAKPKTQRVSKYDSDLPFWLRTGLQVARMTGIADNYKDAKNSEHYRKNLYNAVDPTAPYPNSFLDALYYKGIADASKKESTHFEKRRETDDRTADAAWAKRLKLKYNPSYLPSNSDGSVKLPASIENQIPVDTMFLKDRIAANEQLINNYMRMYGAVPSDASVAIDEGLFQDRRALDSLRHTFKTGEPVVLNEQAYVDRSWIKDGKTKLTPSPLNVLKDYTVKYNKDTNSLDYYDVYDFNAFEDFVPGEPFVIKGSVPVRKQAKKRFGGNVCRKLAAGGSIHIKPSHRGRLTELKARTGKSEAELYNDGNPAHKKMVVFARNARKWKH